MSAPILSTSRKKACFHRPSNHCIPTKKFVLMWSSYITTIHVGVGQGLYELDKQTQPNRRGCRCWKLSDQPCFFNTIWYLHPVRPL